VLFRSVPAALLTEEVAVLASRKNEERSGGNVGYVLDKCMPTMVRQGFEGATNFVQDWVVVPTGRFVIRKVPQQYQEIFSDIIASPVIEECVYRFGIQGSLSLLLQAANVPPPLAKCISISVASLMFGMSHSPNIKDDRFVSTLISGVIYGVMREYGGITDPLMTHVASNMIVAAKERLGLIE